MSALLRSILILLMLLCGSAYAEKVVTLQWDHSIDEPYLQSYRVYYTASTARPQTYVINNNSMIAYNRITDEAGADVTIEDDDYVIVESNTIETSGLTLVFDVDAISANAIKIRSSTGAFNATIEVYYSGGYTVLHNYVTTEADDIIVTEAEDNIIIDQDIINSIYMYEGRLIGSTQTVTKVKITLTADETVTIDDVQVMLLESDSTITPTGDDPGYFDIYKENTEVELHYASDSIVVRCYAVSAIDTRGLEGEKTIYVCSESGVIRLNGDGIMGIGGNGIIKIETIPE